MGLGSSALWDPEGEGKGPAGARGGVAQAPPQPRACLRRPLVLRAVTRGLSRKETAPERGGLVSRPCSCCYRYPSACLSACRSTRSMSGLRVYSTSVTGSREIKSQQSEVTRILDGKRIQYQLVDISQDNALRDEMRALAGNPKATPPQIVNGDQYCGDYELFVEAVEQNTLQEFLKLS